MAIPSPTIPLEKDGTYLPEVWAWYGMGVAVILVRWIVRIRTVGLKGFQGDDYLTLPYLLLYTLNAIIVQVTYYTGGNVDVRPDMVHLLSTEDIRILTYGSIMEFVSWYSYPGLIWTLKFTLLLFYTRLSMNIERRMTIIFLFWACGLSYIALVLTVSFSCRPYHYNWQIRPLPGPECTFRAQNFWTLVSLNVVTDAAIMWVPLPMLWHLRVQLRRKIAVSLLMLSGIFIISTAIVRAAMTISGAPSVININRWGFRETAVGLMAVSAPVIMPIFKPAFWRKGPYIPRERHRDLPPEAPVSHQPRVNHWASLELRSDTHEISQVPQPAFVAKRCPKDKYQIWSNTSSSQNSSADANTVTYTEDLEIGLKQNLNSARDPAALFGDFEQKDNPGLDQHRL